MNSHQRVLADTWTVRYVPTLPHEHPDIYDPARPELALPHTVELAWRRDDERAAVQTVRTGSTVDVDVTSVLPAVTQWFEWTIPPGVDHIDLPLARDVDAATLWLDDVEQRIEPATVVELDPVPSPSRRAKLRVRGRALGGAVFTAPVTYRFEDGVLQTGSWLTQGLRSYSGAVRLRQTFRVVDAVPRSGVLDLGRVRGTVEGRLNGNPLGRRVLPPFQFDLTDRLRAGENELELLVTNTPANYLSTWSRTRVWAIDELESGVFGPVVVRHA